MYANIVCHNKSCSPHLVGVVAIKFHIGSASRVHMWNLILSRTREYVHIYLNHNFTIQLDKQVVILDLTSVRFLLEREWITWKCSIKKTLKYRIQKLGVDIVYFVFSKTAGKWKYAFKSLMLNLCEWMEYLDIERWYLFDCNSRLAFYVRTLKGSTWNIREYTHLWNRVDGKVPHIGSRQEYHPPIETLRIHAFSMS